MRKSSRLPPGFGVDPAALGPSSDRPERGMRRSVAASETDRNVAWPAAGGVRPTLWIGSDGRDGDDADAGPVEPRTPGSILVTAACMGIALAALAYALDFPLS